MLSNLEIQVINFFQINPLLPQILKAIEQIRHFILTNSKFFKIWTDQDVRRLTKIYKQFQLFGYQINNLYFNCLSELVNDGNVNIYLSTNNQLIAISLSTRGDYLYLKLHPNTHSELLEQWQPLLIDNGLKVYDSLMLLVDHLSTYPQTRILYLNTFQTLLSVHNDILNLSQIGHATSYLFRKQLFKYRLLIERLNRLLSIVDYFLSLENFYLDQLQSHMPIDIRPEIIDSELEDKFIAISSRHQLSKFLSIEKCKIQIQSHLVTNIESILDDFCQKGEQLYLTDTFATFTDDRVNISNI